MTPIPYKRSTKLGAPYYVRFQCRGKQYVWSTKTSDLPLAKLRAKEYQEAVIAENYDLVRRQTVGGGGPTFEQLYAAYRGLPYPPEPTREDNIASMTAILAVSGLTPKDRVDRLSRGVVKQWQLKCQKDRPDSSSAIATANSTVRRAKSLFSKRSLDLYLDTDIELPMDAVMEFKAVPLLKEAERLPELPTPEADARAHKELAGESWRGWALARYAGCRAGEIKAARRDWLMGNDLYIGGHPDSFTTKSGKWRVVSLPGPVVAALLAHDDPVYLVGPQREHTVDKRLPVELQLLGFPKNKPLHSCRRLWGSLVYAEQGPGAAKIGLGHSTQQVTDKHYIRNLTAPKPVAYVG